MNQNINCLHQNRDFGHGVNNEIDAMLHYANAGKRRNLSHGLWRLFLVSIVSAAVMWILRRRNRRHTGRHKKHELEIMAFPSGNGQVKYRDS